MANKHRYQNPEEMEPRIDKYFEECDAAQKAYTVPGLCLALGFSSRQTLSNYRQMEEFEDTVKTALLRIEAQRVEQLISSKGNVAGQIFDLKNNFAYQDRTQVDMGNGIVINIIERFDVPPRPVNVTCAGKIDGEAKETGLLPDKTGRET